MSSTAKEPSPSGIDPGKVHVVRRFQDQKESLLGLSWLVAISATFLGIGILGGLRFRGYEPITFSGRAGVGAVDNEATDTSMAELLAEIAAPQTSPLVETAEVETPEVPEMEEPTVETPDLPDLTEALTVEDVFAVPAAPKIVVAQKPVEPSKPQTKPVTKKRNPARTNQPATGTTAAPGGTTGSGGGGGGTGTAGSGAGRGRMPNPSYPSRARARGVIGTVTIRLVIGPAGRITSATVVSTNLTNGGFTSPEQSAVAADIRRNWFLPDRANQTLSLPIRFKLR